MTPTHEGNKAPRRAPSRRAGPQDFAKIAAAVAAAAHQGVSIDAAPPVPAGSTAGALVSLTRGGV